VKTLQHCVAFKVRVSLATNLWNTRATPITGSPSRVHYQISKVLTGRQSARLILLFPAQYISSRCINTPPTTTAIAATSETNIP
jgi:hypothetical protein